MKYADEVMALKLLTRIKAESVLLFQYLTVAVVLLFMIIAGCCFVSRISALAGFIAMLLLCGILAFMHVAKKRSDEANRAKSSLLANMSREIRAPVNTIIGMSELLSNSRLCERDMRFVNDINMSANSLLSIINDFPDMPEIEAGNDFHKARKISAPLAKILVVDDNEFNLRVALGLLDLFEIDAKAASSGKEAIEMILKDDYDIVFLDHMMPEMDGIATIAEIRKLGDKYKQLKIIALTANAIQGAKEMFIAYGFDGLISKPIEIPALTNILIEWLLPGLVVQKSEAETDINTENKDIQCAFADFWEALGQIKEIDREIGLRRVNGQKDMYRNNLRLFYERLKENRDKMTEYMGGEDLKNFSTAVRSMKSMLEGVGAAGLSNAALKLETASRNNDAEYCAKHFPGFIIRLFSLNEQLAAIFPPEEAAPEKEKACISRFREKITMAMEAADRYDNDAGIKILNELSAYDFGEEARGLLENALTALKRYNYDAAKEFLSKIPC